MALNPYKIFMDLTPSPDLSHIVLRSDKHDEEQQRSLLQPDRTMHFCLMRGFPIPLRFTWTPGRPWTFVTSFSLQRKRWGVAVVQKICMRCVLVSRVGVWEPSISQQGDCVWWLRLGAEWYTVSGGEVFWDHLSLPSKLTTEEKQLSLPCRGCIRDPQHCIDEGMFASSCGLFMLPEKFDISCLLVMFARE